MARLFISYKREDQDYAFALRQWLVDARGWTSTDIFVDLDQLRAGDEWAKKLFEEAEAAEVMLFLASENSLHPDSFCYRELRRARGPTIAVTLRGLDPHDVRLARALPYGATVRQIIALDQQPTSGFEFTSQWH
jgi:TIR domain